MVSRIKVGLTLGPIAGFLQVMYFIIHQVILLVLELLQPRAGIEIAEDFNN